MFNIQVIKSRPGILAVEVHPKSLALGRTRYYVGKYRGIWVGDFAGLYSHGLGSQLLMEIF